MTTEAPPVLAPSPDASGPEAFDAYLRSLAEQARKGGRWGAAHERKARGELSGHWQTPRETLNYADQIALYCGCQITLDVCASPGSAVVDDWFGFFHIEKARRNALDPALIWEAPPGRDGRRGMGWDNPPYSEIGAFVDRTISAPSPMMLLAYNRSDTRWMQDKVLPNQRGFWVRKGRITFVDPVTNKAGAVAPAPSFLAVFGADLPELEPRDFGPWRWLSRSGLGRAA